MHPFDAFGSVFGCGPRYRRLVDDQFTPLPTPNGLTPLGLGVYNGNLSSLTAQFGQQRQDLNQFAQAMNLSGLQNAYRPYVDRDRRRAEQELNAFYDEAGMELPFPDAGLPE